MTEKFNDFMNQVDIATHNLNEKEKIESERVKHNIVQCTQHSTFTRSFNFQ